MMKREDAETTAAELVTAFGSFQLRRDQRQLVKDGQPVTIGSRALDLLIALLDHAGEVVSKEALIARVWPGISVEETNLRVNIAALRKALGDGQNGARYIANVPGRGYSFVGGLERGDQTSLPAPAAPRVPAKGSSLPLSLTRLIGRQDAVADLTALLGERRLVTLAGPGGIGKTTVGLAVATGVEDQFTDGARFVDLSTVLNPSMVASAVASAFKLAQHAGDATDRLIEALQGRQVLIVLDGCEHVIDAVAILVEQLLKRTPDTRILATSREPLRIDGEWVHRVQPLDIPAPARAVSAADALRSSSVQLFVERAASGLGGYEFTDADAPAIAEICRKLDGIALAIELAAGHMGALGTVELGTLLEDRFSLLRQGRRTALPRQQTLRATLDWSYDLLANHEQIVLARLAVFNGAFTLAAARVLGTCIDTTSDQVAAAVSALVAKSMLAAEPGETHMHYRLLDTTRAYALEKLAARTEDVKLAGCHARYFRELLEDAAAGWASMTSADWLATYARQINNVRAALTWAFSPVGNKSTGIALTVAAIPLWSELSLVDECIGWVERSLAAVQLGPEPDPRRVMQLQAALGGFQMYIAHCLDSAVECWTAVLDLAGQLGERDYQLRALRALWANAVNRGEFRQALVPAERFRSLAEGDSETAELAIADRMTGACLHFLGDLAGARIAIERSLLHYERPASRSHTVRFQFDQRIASRITLQRILWLQGFPDQALRSIDENIAEANTLDHVLSICNALTQAACPIALLAGDLTAARRYVSMLEERTALNAMDVWRTYTRAFQGDLMIRTGATEAGLGLVEPAITELRQAGFGHNLTGFLMTAAAGHLAAGNIAAGQAAIEEALSICRRTGEGWSVAELHRIRGEILLMENPVKNSAAAELAFEEALETARRQGALAWELRASSSMGRMLASKGEADQGARLLSVVCAKFHEGLAAPDYLEATALLSELQAS